MDPAALELRVSIPHNRREHTAVRNHSKTNLLRYFKDSSFHMNTREVIVIVCTRPSISMAAHAALLPFSHRSFPDEILVSACVVAANNAI